MISAIVALALAAQGAQSVSGAASAADGDSLVIGGSRVRLYGIDAPELSQTCTRGGARWACGQLAAAELAKLVKGRDVQCAAMGIDAYRRTVARCSAGGIDLNRTMVALGYAVAFRRYSMDYISAEDSARSNRRGIWSGTFEMPADVRAAEQPPSPVPAAQTERRERAKRVYPIRQIALAPTTSCRIKGNHSRRGELIYHLPGRPYYDQTRAEQMFCTEADARAAGYRRSRAHSD